MVQSLGARMAERRQVAVESVFVGAGRQVEQDATVVQQLPDGNGVDVARLVQADIEARAELGRERYGQRLQPHNGRDALVDAYQEVLDLAMYLRQRLEEER